MADDNTKIKEDRKLVAESETYEVAAFARKYGVSPSEAKKIIKSYGPSREKLDAHMRRGTLSDLPDLQREPVRLREPSAAVMARMNVTAALAIHARSATSPSRLQCRRILSAISKPTLSTRRLKSLRRRRKARRGSRSVVEHPGVQQVLWP